MKICISPALKPATMLLSLMLSTLPLSVNSLVLDEFQVKAAFLNNFSRFIFWPESKNVSTIQFCVLGKNPFQDILDVMMEEANKTSTTPRNVRYFTYLPEDFSSCHILYISKSERNYLSEIFKKINQHPLLTVSSIADFVKKGGMIEFRIKAKKVRLYINHKNILKAGLKADANLLRVGTVVE